MNADGRAATEQPGVGASVGGPARDPVPVRLLSGALAVVAVGIGTALVGSGASLPALGPVLLLASIAALCINRSVFFPSEQAATAEAAVLLAAVTAFDGRGAWLGPLVVALLVGPLDVAHWEGRSYVRMMYNAGNRGLSVLAATATFLVVSGAAPDLVGSHGAVVDLTAALAAAGAFALVDVILSSTLLVAQGAHRRAAVGHVLTIDRLTVPLAVAGALAGFLAVAVGWWAIAVVLVPVAFVPERVIARATPARRELVRRAGWATAVGVGGGLALWLLLPGADLASGVALVVVAVVVGFELEVDARRAVPPLLALVVVAALVVVRGDGAWAAAVVAVVAGTLVSWSLAPVRTGRRVVVASLLAAGATAAAVGATGLAGSGRDAPAIVLGTAVLFAVLVVSVGTGRRARLVAFGWSAPLVAVTVATAGVWRTLGTGGALLVLAWLAAVGIAAASWGPLPWLSRGLSPISARVRVRAHRLLLLGITVAALASAVAAVACPAGDPRTVAAGVAVALAASVATASSIGVRQWRFVPRQRAVAASMAGLAAVVAVSAGPGLAAGNAWAVAPVAVSVALAVGAGWRPSRCADAAVAATGSRDTRGVDG